jgi:soluble lytic murein transglycosylase-like protein
MSIKFPLGSAVLLSLALAGCQTVSNETTSSISPSKKPYDTIIAKYALENDVPEELAHAVVFSESTYKPDARGSAGEIGLMQLKLATARGVGYRGSAKGLYDPETNIKYGMIYLGQARKLSGGTTCGTILKYNAGHGARRMNPISQAYCNKVSGILKSGG